MHRKAINAISRAVYSHFYFIRASPDQMDSRLKRVHREQHNTENLPRGDED